VINCGEDNASSSQVVPTQRAAERDPDLRDENEDEEAAAES
jgi:hypothetical protein